MTKIEKLDDLLQKIYKNPELYYFLDDKKKKNIKVKCQFIISYSLSERKLLNRPYYLQKTDSAVCSYKMYKELMNDFIFVKKALQLDARMIRFLQRSITGEELPEKFYIYAVKNNPNNICYLSFFCVEDFYEKLALIALEYGYHYYEYIFDDYKDNKAILKKYNEMKNKNIYDTFVEEDYIFYDDLHTPPKTAFDYPVKDDDCTEKIDPEELYGSDFYNYSDPQDHDGYA